jgi:branched-chain amino acid transport system ATP-binding protein
MAAEASKPRLEKGAGAVLDGVGLYKTFGALTVLEDVNFSVAANEAVGIVGPNGAGKTTLLSVLAGGLPASAGAVHFRGANVSAIGASDRSRMGLAKTHQVPRPFGGMTVFENVFVAATHAGGLQGQKAYAACMDSMELCGMVGVANRRAESLGLLDRKRLELARALATNPVVVLLDEIGGGLTDEETVQLVETIREMRRRGMAIVWIEHIVHVLLQVVERLVCMVQGRVIADGDPRQVMTDPTVVAAYLGSAPT